MISGFNNSLDGAYVESVLHTLLKGAEALANSIERITKKSKRLKQKKMRTTRSNRGSRVVIKGRRFTKDLVRGQASLRAEH